MSEYNVTFLVLVNPKSGGQDGPHLLEKFTDIFREVREGFQKSGIFHYTGGRGQSGSFSMFNVFNMFPPIGLDIEIK